MAEMEKMIVVKMNEMGGPGKMIPMDPMSMKTMSMSTDSCIVPINVCDAAGDGYMMGGNGLGGGGGGGMYGMNSMNPAMVQMMSKMYGMGMDMGLD